MDALPAVIGDFEMIGAHGAFAEGGVNGQPLAVDADFGPHMKGQSGPAAGFFWLGVDKADGGATRDADGPAHGRRQHRTFRAVSLQSPCHVIRRRHLLVIGEMHSLGDPALDPLRLPPRILFPANRLASQLLDLLGADRPFILHPGQKQNRDIRSPLEYVRHRPTKGTLTVRGCTLRKADRRDANLGRFGQFDVFFVR